MVSMIELCIGITMFCFVIILLCFQYIWYHSDKSEILCDINNLKIIKLCYTLYPPHMEYLKDSSQRLLDCDKGLETSYAIIQPYILCYIILKPRLLHYSLTSITFFLTASILFFFSDAVSCKQKWLLLLILVVVWPELDSLWDLILATPENQSHMGVISNI